MLTAGRPGLRGREEVIVRWKALHSMIIDPWGEVVVRAGEGEQIISGEIDQSRIDKIRRELPLIRHRRTDLYRLSRVE